MSFQVKQFRMGASSLFGKGTEETVPQTELREKGLCKEYLFHSYPLCVWQHVTCVFRGCHGWGGLIDSSVGPVVHAVAVRSSNSFDFHLVINILCLHSTMRFKYPLDGHICHSVWLDVQSMLIQQRQCLTIMYYHPKMSYFKH